MIAVIDDQNNRGRRRNIALTIAAVLAIGLVWAFYGGTSDKEARIKVMHAMTKASEVQSAIAAYYADRKVFPQDNSALRLPNKEPVKYLTAFEQQAVLSFEIIVQNGSIVLTFASDQDPVSGETLVFVPSVVNGGLEWTCNKGTVDKRYRPPQCRGR
jgi:hypothetical protein